MNQPAFTLKPVLFVLGELLAILGVFMFVPGFVDAWSGDADWMGFFIASGFTTLTGLLLVFTNFERHLTLNRRQAFLLTALSWVGISAFSAMPFTFSRLSLSYTDALFEAVSGLTTTGSTVITGLDVAPPGDSAVAVAAALAGRYRDCGDGDFPAAVPAGRRDAAV